MSLLGDRLCMLVSCTYDQGLLLGSMQEVVRGGVSRDQGLIHGLTDFLA